jgi:L-lactate utilization protein LutB
MKKKIEKTLKNLVKNEFKAHYCETVEEARRLVSSMVPAKATVGFGGSKTVRDMGLVEMLSGRVLFDHWKAGLSAEQVLETRKKQLTADVFITGTNAVTEKGELVNKDGIGNRVCAMAFGPGMVIVVAGRNKVVKNVKAGIRRIERVAAPLRNKSLNTKNPCVKTGRCMDCNRDTRICRILTVLERRPSNTDVRVVLVGEEMGF